MKNTKIILGIVMICLTTSSTKSQNPYQSLGIDEEVLTLSNGKYQEFFPNDTIQPIGDVLLNTITGKIEAFIEVDTLYPEWNLEPEVVSRFLSHDPLARSYPELTPYQLLLTRPSKALIWMV